MLFNRKNLAAITAIGALALAGCAAPDPQPQPDTQQTQEQTQDQNQQSPGTGATENADDKANTPDGSASQGTVFTSKSITANGFKLKIDLYEIEDDGALATVKIDFTNEDADGEKFQVSGFFGDGNSMPPGKTTNPDPAWIHSMRGVTLTDTQNKKIHRVAYDTSGQCLCDMGLSSTFVSEGDTIQLTASFAPLPDGQNTATVTIPNFGTFKDVPINR